MIGQTIKELRTRRYMTQEELAEASGLATRYISHLETGHKDPLLSTLRKLAKGLSVPLILVIHLLEDEISQNDASLHADLAFYTDELVDAKNRETLVL